MAVDALFIEARSDEVVDVAALEDVLLRTEVLGNLCANQSVRRASTAKFDLCTVRDATLLPHADRREQRHGL